VSLKVIETDTDRSAAYEDEEEDSRSQLRWVAWELISF